MEFSEFSEIELAGIFNDNLVDLLDQLNAIVISLTEQNIIDKRSKANLDFYKNLINRAMGLSKEIVIEGFGSYILKEPGFMEKILERDETYFISYNFTENETDKNLEELVNIIKSVITLSLIHI